jgi:membrane fusion protein (multidrug efflux system)
MAEQEQKTPFMQSGRARAIAGAGAVLLVIVAAWFWMTRGRESTDDAQVDARVTQLAARVGGTVLRVAIKDNEPVDQGAVLVEIDPRDYQVAIERARAELADAEAASAAALSEVPLTSTTASSGVVTAEGSVDQARASVDAAQKEVDAARARRTSSEARLREVEANAARISRDAERLRGLHAKDEVSTQQFENAVAAAEAQKAAVDLAKSQIAEADAGIRVAESRLAQSRAMEQQAHAGLKSAQTVPEKMTAIKARAASAQARVASAKAALSQAELNLQYTSVRAPAKGIIAKKSVNIGQVVQAGQPLVALVEIDDVWITANFKETQLADMKPGQRATVTVDAYGGRKFEGHIDSIAAATGARFSLLPPENATGNFVKVVQRVPVKIVLETGQDAEHTLRPGMSVVPTVFTRE